MKVSMNHGIVDTWSVQVYVKVNETRSFMQQIYMLTFFQFPLYICFLYGYKLFGFL